MHHIRLRLAPVLLVLGVFSAVPAKAQGIDLSQLGSIVQQASNELAVQINLSGRQRMLIQKMSKEALLMALGVQPEKTRAKLRATMALFERTLINLMKGDKEQHLPPTSDEAILKQLNKVLTLWKAFKPYVAAAVDGLADEAMLEEIAKRNLPLLVEMNKAVKMYERASGADTAELAVVINLSGRQRMLTQKMAKEYLLAALEIEPEKNRAALKKTMALFDRTLKGLRDGDEEQELPPTKDPAIRAQLDKVVVLWDQYRTMLQKPAKQSDLSALEAMNLKILAEMDHVVKMYEESW